MHNHGFSPNTLHNLLARNAHHKFNVKTGAPHVQDLDCIVYCLCRLGRQDMFLAEGAFCGIQKSMLDFNEVTLLRVFQSR